jgi:hypothetical protein
MTPTWRGGAHGVEAVDYHGVYAYTEVVLEGAGDACYAYTCSCATCYCPCASCSCTSCTPYSSSCSCSPCTVCTPCTPCTPCTHLAPRG